MYMRENHFWLGHWKNLFCVFWPSESTFQICLKSDEKWESYGEHKPKSELNWK